MENPVGGTPQVPKAGHLERLVEVLVHGPEGTARARIHAQLGG